MQRVECIMAIVFAIIAPSFASRVCALVVTILANPIPIFIAHCAPALILTSAFILSFAVSLCAKALSKKAFSIVLLIHSAG